MNYSLITNRMTRRLLKGLFHDDIFDHAIVQRLLGFRKNGSCVIDTVQGLSVEYAYDSAIGRDLFYSGHVEEVEISFVISALNDEKPVIMDIGANIGFHSLRWAQGISGAVIFAFEPSPWTFAVLSRNVERNSLSHRITVVPEAVSNSYGYSVFFQCEDNAFSSLKDTKRKKIVHSCEVPVTSIDNFVNKNGMDKISLIKIDVEGLEKEVILGGDTTIRNHLPDLFVEIYGGTDSNSDPAGTVDLIRSFGYKAFSLRCGKAVPYSGHSDDFYNYYFTVRDDGTFSR